MSDPPLPQNVRSLPSDSIHPSRFQVIYIFNKREFQVNVDHVLGNSGLKSGLKTKDKSTDIEKNFRLFPLIAIYIESLGVKFFVLFLFVLF